tara:strand:+ start:1941 stop:2585 length:645 start_codon:yes stop_codon:yes gene_type:complete
MDAALATATLPKVPHYKAEPSGELSCMLQTLADNAQERVSVNQICDALGNRSFGAFLLVFCLPNLVPLPPGSSAILGIPLIIIAFQILAGHSKIWLPKRLANYSLASTSFKGMIAKINPHLRRGERMIKPRFWPLSQIFVDRLFGIFALVLAIVVTIPIPLGNWPPAFALAFLAAAYIKKDGVFLAVGAMLGFASLFLAGTVLAATAVLFMHLV